MAETTTSELLREALDEARELVRLEVAIAREQVRAELAQAKVAGVELGGAAVAAILAAAMLLVAIVVAFRREWLAALVVAGALACVAVALAVSGWRKLPKHPLSETKERVEADVKELKERVA